MINSKYKNINKTRKTCLAFSHLNSFDLLIYSLHFYSLLVTPVILIVCTTILKVITILTELSTDLRMSSAIRDSFPLM